MKKKKKNRTCNNNNNTEEKVKKALFIFPEKNKYKKTRSREGSIYMSRFKVSAYTKPQP